MIEKGIFKSNLKFSEKFNGLIWRLLINEETGHIAIENREIESKKVFFSVINIESGKIHFKEMSFAEPMNANLAYISKGALLLKLSENLENPESTGLISVNIKSGEVLWEKYNVAIQQVKDYGVQIFDTKIQPRRYQWISHLDGSIIPEQSPNNPNHSSIVFPEIHNTYSFPNFIEHGFIEGSVATLKIGELEIICFHEKWKNNLQQRLLVYQGDRILFEDILISNIQKLQPESFFILNKQLFYIRNKNEIVSYFV